MTPQKGEGFVWPPREGGGAKPTAETERVELAENVRTQGGLLSSLESVWLSPTRVTLGERIRSGVWAPEADGSACARCGHTVGAYEESEFGCATCAGKRPAWSRAVRLGAYEGALIDWIHEVKFERGWRLGEDLGVLLGERLVEEGFEGVVVPMPTTWRRRMARGTDHTLSIARGVARATGSPIVRALGREHRKSQRAVETSDRRSNVSGAFRWRSGAGKRIGGRDVVVVDDVMTSGATMSSACRELARGWKGARGEKSVVAGVRGIWCGVLAVTPTGASSDRGAENASGAS